MPRTPTEFTQAKTRSPGADFADYCCELLGSLGAVEAKRMFLGWGLSVNGLTVAVIAWDRLYLKAHAATLPAFTAAGCQVFEHEAKGRTRRMQYYTAPEGALESRAAMQPWAALAMQAAVAASAPSKAGKAARGQGSVKEGVAEEGVAEEGVAEEGVAPKSVAKRGAAKAAAAKVPGSSPRRKPGA